MNNQCRDGGGDSLHVEYSINDSEQQETENLTHAEFVNDEDIAERGDSNVGWICTFIDDTTDFIQLTATVNDDIDIDHFITAETAEQLSDMFARAAKEARLRSQTRADKLEAKLREAEEIRARQGDLFGGV